MPVRLPAWTRLLPPLYWLLLALVVGLILVGLWWALGAGDRARRRAIEAEASATLAGARTQSARDALGAAVNNAEGAAATDARTKGSEDAIHDAAAADRDAVTLRELCKSPSAGRRPECRLLQPGP